MDFEPVSIFAFVIQQLFYMFIGFMLADFFSGVGHFVEDRYFSKDTFLIGKLIIEPNRQHHWKPREMLKYTPFQNMGTTVLFITIPVTIACYYLNILNTVTITMVAFLTPVNYIHAINHKLDHELSSFERLIEYSGIFQTREDHHAHHKGEHDTYYCIIGKWWNPVLEYIHFWEGLQNIIYALTGVTPHKEESKASESSPKMSTIDKVD
jgi:hypothetical protein